MKATFAAGCFWGVETAFRKVKGVTDVTVGYTGGTKDTPTYDDVCTGKTGHAESVEVTYDPEQVTYKQLLEKFWSLHDPTQGNQQGPDVGSQYRSAIFYHSEEQKQQAEQSKQQEQKNHSKPITTQIIKATTFYNAEEYHQQYEKKRGKVC
jgi:peptide-methionine (S)-S-oxide reductase